MHNNILYENKKNLKMFFIAELIIGLLLPCLFFYFYKSGIYIGLFTIAAPLLGMALINSALNDNKLKKISFNEAKKCLEIKKEALRELSLKEIELANFTVDIREGNKPENAHFIKLTKKIRLIIYESGKEMETLESGFLSRNNRTIVKLYNDLKAIRQADNLDYY